MDNNQTTQTETKQKKIPVYPGGTNQTLEEIEKEVFAEYQPTDIHKQADNPDPATEDVNSLMRDEPVKEESQPEPVAEESPKPEPKQKEKVVDPDRESKLKEELTEHLGELNSSSHEAISSRMVKAYPIDDRRALMDDGYTAEQADQEILKQTQHRQGLIDKAIATSRRLDSSMSRVKLKYREFDRKSDHYNGDLNKLARSLAEVYAKPTKDRLTGEAIEGLDPFDIYKTASSIYTLGYQKGADSVEKAVAQKAEVKAKKKAAAKVAPPSQSRPASTSGDMVDNMVDNLMKAPDMVKIFGS